MTIMIPGSTLKELWGDKWKPFQGLEGEVFIVGEGGTFELVQETDDGLETNPVLDGDGNLNIFWSTHET